MRTHLLLSAVLALVATTVYAEETGTAAMRWPRFRGPDGSGVAAEGMRLPAEFGPDQHVVWKTAVPPGHSSPCVWDERIFLTAFDKPKNQLLTLCVDRRTGNIIWSKPAPAEKLEKVHSTSSPATATPVTDGQRVVVYFGSCGLVCYDFAGNELWKMAFPTPPTRFGTGTSPVLAENVVLLTCPEEKAFVLAVAADTGKKLWQLDKPKCTPSYACPLVRRFDGGHEVILQGYTGVSGFDLKDGKERWTLGGSMAQAIASPVAAEGLMFCVNQLPGADLDDRWKLPSFAELLEKFDKNKDGQLSKDEIPKNFVIYSRGDPDGVGDITLASVIASVDANKDGFISRLEWFAGTAMASMLQNTLMALRTDTAGDGKPPQIAWKEKASLPEIPSPLYYRGRLYLIRNRGLASCWEAKAGKLLYDERVGTTGNYYASPVAGDGKVYVISTTGVVTVLAAGDTFKVLAKNDLGESVVATPALVDGKIYLRTDGHLYAFGE